MKEQGDKNSVDENMAFVIIPEEDEDLRDNMPEDAREDAGGIEAVTETNENEVNTEAEIAEPVENVSDSKVEEEPVEDEDNPVVKEAVPIEDVENHVAEETGMAEEKADIPETEGENTEPEKDESDDSENDGSDEDGEDETTDSDDTEPKEGEDGYYLDEDFDDFLDDEDEPDDSVDEKPKKKKKSVVPIFFLALIAVMALFYFGWNKIGEFAVSRLDRFSESLFGVKEPEVTMAETEAETEPETEEETTTVAETTTAAPTLTVEGVRDFDSEELNKLTDIEAEATDTLISQNGRIYVAKNMVDGSLDSSWQVHNDETLGVGEKITFTFPEPEPIKAIRYLGGNVRTEALYTENCRPEEFFVTFITTEGEFTETLTLEDEAKFQSFQIIGDIPVKEVVIEMTKAYKGTKYNDLCITEIEFYR